MAHRERWLDQVAFLPTAEDIQRNRLMHLDQRGPIAESERLSRLKGTNEERVLLESRRRCHNELLSDELISGGRSLARANWLPERRLARMTVRRGSLLQLAGFTCKDVTYLFPEEALFFMEMGHLELTHCGLPVSMQQAYSLLLSDDDLPYKIYRVYAYLLRGGYNVYVHAHHRAMLEKSPTLYADEHSSNSGGSDDNDLTYTSPSKPSSQVANTIISGSHPAASKRDNVSGDRTSQCVVDPVCTSSDTDAAAVKINPSGGRCHEAVSTRSPDSGTEATAGAGCPDWISHTVRRLMVQGERRLLSGASHEPAATSSAPTSLVPGTDTICTDRASSVPCQGEGSAAPSVLSHGKTRCPSDCADGTAPKKICYQHAVLQPSMDITKDSILDKLDMFSSPPKSESACVKFDLEVYHHKGNFRKTDPGDPDYYLCVCDGLMATAPSMAQIMSTRSASGGKPVRWVIADENRVHFYSLESFSLPTLQPALSDG